jgi:CHAT domain-containing protein
MRRVLVGLGLGLTLAGGWCATADDDPPKELTADERKELEAKWKEQTSAFLQSYRAGKLPEAAEAGQKALETARRLYPKQDHPLLAGSLNNLAAVLTDQRKYADAEKFHREALEMRRRLYPKQDHPLLAGSLNNLASLLWHQEKYAEAEPLYREALDMRRRLYDREDHPELVATLNNLATVLEHQQKYADAETYFRNALEMARRLYAKQDPAFVTMSLNNLGRVLWHQGKYAEAESLSREALDMSRRLYPKQDHPFVAGSLNNLAILLTEQGKYAEAETLHRETLDMRRRLFGKQDHPEVALSLHNLAVALQYQRKTSEAETLYGKALEMRRRLYPRLDHPDLAATLNNLASLLGEREKYAEAEPLYREALDMRSRLYAREDRPELAESLNNLAAMLVDQGKYAEAETLYRQALDMRRRLYAQQDHPNLAMSLNNLAHLYRAQGKYADAERLFRQALAMYRSLARDYAAVRSEGDALTLAASYPSTRDNFLSSAWMSKAAAATVYAEVWASKAALGRFYEQRALAARAAATDPRAAALLDQISDRRRRADLLLAPLSSDGATARQRDTDLVQLARDIETLNRQLRPLLPTLERADKLAQATPADLQKVLPADAAVVDFLQRYLFEQDPKVPGKKGGKVTDRYLAFVLTRDKVSWIELGEAEPIEGAITAWREAITAGKDVPPEVPAKVRELVWAKVQKELPEQVKMVYLCPDRELCRVPWAALPGDKPDTVLLEKYALANLPHAEFLLDKLWPPDAGPKRPTEVLAVGGVAYDAAPLPAEKPAVNRGEPLLKPRQQPGWMALPSAAAEVKGVMGAAKKKDLVCRTLEKEEATTSAVLTALPKVRFAHLATHGFFADASFRSAFQVDARLFRMGEGGERIGAGTLSPMVMTGLVFAGANNPKTPGRGIVTGEALVDLDLSGLELAVLSACETGLGHVADGEGTFGLQRAFHLAGTRDVIASLWKVPDRPTAALMALFYRNLWEKGMPPVEALRQAQLEIYRHPEKIPELAAGFRGKIVEVPGTEETPAKATADGKAHPRLWAAFALSGPGR